MHLSNAHATRIDHILKSWGALSIPAQRAFLAVILMDAENILSVPCLEYTARSFDAIAQQKRLDAVDAARCPSCGLGRHAAVDEVRQCERNALAGFRWGNG